MTRRANDLEMTKSTFANPWGKSDPEQRVTARDMAHLAAHIIRTYPQYYHYFGEKDFTWNKIHQMNRNPLLTMELGADGLKTGDIKESGFGLVGSAVQNGQRLILVLNGLKSANERAEEARRILNWGFRSFDRKTLFSETDIIGTAKVFGGSVNEVGLVSNKPITLLLPRTSGDKLIGKLTYMGPLIAPVEQGNEVAKLRLYRGNALVQETPLFTASSVNVGSLTQRSIDAGLELGLTLFRQMVQKSK